MFPFFDSPIVPAPLKIKTLVSKMSAELGISPVPTALVDMRLDGVVNAMAIDRINPDTKVREFAIVFPPDALEVFKTMANLKGVIAHELGHIANDDMAKYRAVSRENEFRADEFAAKHGYGKQLAESLSLVPDTDDTPIEMMDHPLTRDRVSRIASLVK